MFAGGHRRRPTAAEVRARALAPPCPYCYQLGVHASAYECRLALDWSLDGPARMAAARDGRVRARRDRTREARGWSR